MPQEPPMTDPFLSSPTAPGDEVVAAATAGDEAAFATLVERHRRELQVHCYRMLRSFEQAEDAVQETFLRAWRARSTFAGRSKFRTWLYCIATNACRDELSRAQRRAPIRMLGVEADTPTWGPMADSAIPGDALDELASSDQQPDAVVVAKEALELALVAAIILLSQRQRAVLIMRDVLRWSASETAELLRTTVPAVNSALQRARATLDEHRPSQEYGGLPASRLSSDERQVLERFVEALGRADTAAVAQLVCNDAAPELFAKSCQKVRSGRTQGQDFAELVDSWSLIDAEAVVAA